MQDRSSAAVKLLSDLDAELAAASQPSGERLVWSAAEVQAREMLADTVDRRLELVGRYQRTRETTRRVKISAEIRLLDKQIMLLLKAIRTDVPQPESLVTIKNRRAANIRWDRARAQA